MESIDDISKMLFNDRLDIMGQAGMAIIEKKYGHLINQEYCSCPICDRRVKAMPKKVKREITTLIGPIGLYRPYFYCKSCHYGFYPLDEILGLSNRKTQADIQEVEAW
ncbi:MAG: ISKra4 family transposase, partial [Maritimibacter sp.]